MRRRQKFENFKFLDISQHPRPQTVCLEINNIFWFKGRYFFADEPVQTDLAM
jgi:hypothetical protein